MLVGGKLSESNTAMQERVQRHYGHSIAAGDSPRLVATDNSAVPHAGQLASNPSWQAALADAMSRTGALAEAQAAISEREAALAQREVALAQREQALQADRQQQAFDLLQWRPMVYAVAR